MLSETRVTAENCVYIQMKCNIQIYTHVYTRIVYVYTYLRRRCHRHLRRDFDYLLTNHRPSRPVAEE